MELNKANLLRVGFQLHDYNQQSYKYVRTYTIPGLNKPGQFGVMIRKAPKDWLMIIVSTRKDVFEVASMEDIASHLKGNQYFRQLYIKCKDCK